MNKKITGAGIIPVFDNKNLAFSDLPKDIIYLTLIDYKNQYDFPKGGYDKTDNTAFNCALREMKEECALRYEDFYNFHSEIDEEAIHCGQGLYLFVGKIKPNHLIKILPNEKSGFVEHLGYKWCTYNDLMNDKSLLPLYLKQGLSSSQELIKVLFV